MSWRSAIIVLLVTSMILGCGLFAAATEPAPIVRPATELPCLASGDQNTIMDRIDANAGVANLCPGAVFELTAPIRITSTGNQIYTEGLPTDDSRAVLRIVNPSLTTAVIMRDYSDVLLSNVIVDGNRTNLGPMQGDALIYAGGFSYGQIIRGNKIMDPRSWSALQIIEGGSAGNECRNALIENNEIGPAGTSDDLQWADGISMACSKSTVRNNVITDATDGGIVVFGAPGSVIEGNTIRAETRTLLGGINMVDNVAYAGSYEGTVVKDNVIDASGAVIRIGLGMGSRVWGCLPSDSAEILTGGTVTANTLRGEHMQYGFIVDGVSDWTVTDNIDEATHSGHPSVDCYGTVASAPAGFLYNPERAEGVFQSEFVPARLDLALWAIVAPRLGE